MARQPSGRSRGESIDERDGGQGSKVCLVFRQSKRKLQETEANAFLDLGMDQLRRWGCVTDVEMVDLESEIGGQPHDTGPDEREIEIRVTTTKNLAVRMANPFFGGNNMTGKSAVMFTQISSQVSFEYLKGHLISKCLFGVIVLTKIATRIL